MQAHEEQGDGQKHWQAYKPMYLGAAGVTSVLVAVWAVLTFCVYPAGAAPSDAIAARGQFGDMFGLANALFSGLAFTALIFSLHMQRRELALQRDELRLTRNELALQREELKLTRDEMALARNEAVKQAQALTEQAATMARQATYQLLAARIQGAGMLLQVQFESVGKPVVQSLMALDGNNVYDEAPKRAKELVILLKEAERLSAANQHGAAVVTAGTSSAAH